MIKTKPCSKCGKHPELYELSVTGLFSKIVRVFFYGCKECSTYGARGRNKTLAAKAWNNGIVVTGDK